jgi:hypothetical protein
MVGNKNLFSSEGKRVERTKKEGHILLFSYYVNLKLRTTIGLEDFETAHSLMPPLMQGAVLHELVKGPKIKTWMQMPPKNYSSSGASHYHSNKL